MNTTHPTPPVRHGEEIEIDVASLAFGGDSVGRFKDFAVFIPGGLPGERVRLKIVQVKDHYAVGEILQVLRHSPDRVQPPCPIFQECGGCQWQHFSYPRQLQTKRQFVVDAFQRIGKMGDVTVQPCLPSPSPYAYRNKAMPVLSMRDGHFITGIYEPRSHHLVPYTTCAIQADGINQFLQKVTAKIDQSGLTPYQEKKHSGFLRHLTVRQGQKTGEFLLAFVTRTEDPEERVQKPTLLPEPLEGILPRLARELMEETPGLVGVLQNINPSRTNIVFGPTTRVLAGRDHYFEVIDDLKLKVSLRSFLQVNTAQADILHTVVREALGAPTGKKRWGTILDLYSGIGTLAMAVSPLADYVVGIEEIGPAVEDAKENAKLNQRANIDFLEGDVAPILLGLREKGMNRVDAVLLDPPRKGVLPEVLARVTSLHPERIVYVSCDPSTLARDLALLSKHGYLVDWAQPLDMFPQTYHTETVVRLTREKPVLPETPEEAALAGETPFRVAAPIAPPKPQDVSDNFRYFKDRTAGLMVAVGQQFGAAFGLAWSLVSFLGRSAAQGAVGAGRGLGRALRAGSDATRKTREVVGQVGAETATQLGKAARDGVEAGQKTFQWMEQAIARTRDQSQGPATDEGNRPASKAAQFLQAIEEEVLTERVESVIEEETQAFVVEAEEERSFVPAEPPAPVMKTQWSEATVQEAPSPVQEEVVQEPLEAPTPEVVQRSIPPEREPEEAPVVLEQLQAPPEPEPVLAVAPAPVQPPIPAEVPVQELTPSVPAEEVPSARPSAPPPPVPLPLSPSRKALFRDLRWAVILAILVGGGYWAAATFSPDAKRLGVLIPLETQLVPDVIAVMPARDYKRYEMVPVEVKISDQEKEAFSEMQASVQVTRNGEPVTWVQDRTVMPLKKDNDQRRFHGNWPIPFNPIPGTYVAEVTVHSPRWKSPKVFQSAFTISPLKPSGLYPGYAALTMEGGKQLVGGAVPALDGSDSLRAANAVEWAKFMGANIYCYLMGQTSIWDHMIARDFPFSRGDMEVGKKYAKLCHQAGLKFAGYMTTFKVVGDAWAQAPYQFSLGYDRETGEVAPTRFISLQDEHRHHDVVQFLQELDQDPDIDMIGLDYVRTGDAGYELVDEFVNDLDVPVPNEFAKMSRDERIHWLAETVESGKKHKIGKEVNTLFQWWRAHKVALTLKGILEEAKVSKPVFTFTLGWEMGHQHGQDPAMYVDAGVNFNQIMLYEGDRNTLKSMKTQWPQYLARCNGEYAPGEMVDFNWVQKSLDPPGPEELYDREVGVFQDWFTVNSSLGMFWHDLYRIVYGVRGPYSSMEWAVAGGKAFSTMQRMEGLVPIDMTLVAPERAPGGVPIPLSVEIRNQSNEAIKGVVLHQVDTSKNYYTDLATVGPFDLPSGHMVRVKNLFANLPKTEDPARDDRYMAAVLLEKPGQAMRVFDFAYMKKVPAGKTAPFTDTTDGGKPE
ncbi:MAG TPA: 23S rRNA (uracil(1939)-C(5))-methyltransferase RlmD [bacterium]|nr:23S rRNA (uracil(1939)-C(5))-methyltransferase RlmD [bacterium]